MQHPLTVALAAATAVVMIAGATAAYAADQAGTIVAVEGAADIGRGDEWIGAEAGGTVLVGDRLRTGSPGRVRVVLLDDSVVNVGDASLFTIDEHVFDPDAGKVSSLMKLLKGKVRSLVSEYYEDPLASFEIETVTAVSGVRGTEFVVVYDEEAATTDVVGVSGRVEVHSVLDRRDRSVFVTAGHATSVVRGAFPTPPRPVSDDTMRRYLRGVKTTGSGAAESMTFDEPVLQGGAVDPQDTAEAPGMAPAPSVAHAPTKAAPDPSSDGPGEDRSTPGDALDQPAPVLERRGEVQVQFQRTPR